MQRNSNTHTNTFSEPNRDSHSYSDGDAYGHTYRDGETYTNPEDRSHAKISAHARAAPMTRRIKTVVVEDLVVTETLIGKPGRRFASVAALIRTK